MNKKGLTIQWLYHTCQGDTATIRCRYDPTLSFARFHLLVLTRFQTLPAESGSGDQNIHLKIHSKICMHNHFCISFSHQGQSHPAQLESSHLNSLMPVWLWVTGWWKIIFVNAPLKDWKICTDLLICICSSCWYPGLPFHYFSVLCCFNFKRKGQAFK